MNVKLFDIFFIQLYFAIIIHAFSKSAPAHERMNRILLGVSRIVGKMSSILNYVIFYLWKIYVSLAMHDAIMIIKWTWKSEMSWLSIGGGWGCEVSCGGHHRQRGKTPMGSALDGAVLDFTQILAYLVHNMSRSQLYLGFGHFGWLPSFFGQ